MAVWSAVSISALEYSRFDADFYHPTYLNELESWRRLDKRIGVAKLGRITAAPVRTGRTPKSRLIKGEEETVRFIKTDTVREGSVDFNNSALLPLRVVGDRDIIPNDAVVMTIIGATPEIVGRTAIVRTNDPACVTNQNVAVICTSGKFDPFFLTAYFQTKWGRDQVWRHSRRTEQVNLNCREVERVLVPNPPLTTQEAIGNLVRSSFAATDRSIELYERAQQVLEEELGLDKLTFQKSVGYIAQLSDLECFRRADADFFNPELRYLQRELEKNLGLKPLSEYANVLKFSNPPYAAEGIPIITQKHLGSIAPADFGDDLVAPNSWAAENPDAVLRKNDLLYYSVGAYLGKTNQWLSNDKAVHASFITMLRCHSEADASYLQALLNSRYGLLQSKCFQSGTAQPYIYPKDIRRFLVPNCSEAIRGQIHSLMMESYEKGKESNVLLEQAKTRVEQLIEEAIYP